MEAIRMGRGQYWGDPIETRSEPVFLLTLCRYESNREFPIHAHEQSGLFFMIHGDHIESDHRQTFHQTSASGIWHGRGFEHATRVGPKGMLGLNISIRNEVDLPTQTDVRFFNSPSTAFLGLRVFAAVKQQLSPTETENRVWELLADTVGPEPKEVTCVDKIREQIRETFQDPIGLSHLARAAGIHPVYLARAYRQRFGIPVSQEIQQLRLGHALSLAAAGMSLGEAAIEAGFADQAHMTRLSTRLLGTSPKALIS